MRNLRWTIPTLALAALLTGGCMLTSGQFIVSFDLPTPLPISQTAIQHMDVDLHTVGAYNDHKSDLKGVPDVALLGQFTNTGGTPVDVSLWMTPALTAFETADQVVLPGTGAVRIWGPLHLGVGESKKVGWDQSAGLFRTGRAALVEQIKGDGVFTLYALGASGSYAFRLDHGALVAVIDAAK